MNNITQTVLIIEDDPVLQAALHEGLNASYTILTASDGEAALKSALENKPDIILLDIMLPKMDGLAVLEQLRADAWGKKAVVVVLTNLSDVDTEMKAKSLGVSGFYTKANITIKGLVQYLHEIVK